MTQYVINFVVFIICLSYLNCVSSTYYYGISECAVHNLTNKDLHDALEPAKKYFHTKAGKDFIDNNLDDIVRHLLSQSPRNLSITRDNVGQSEYAMVEKSIRFALVLIVEDLRTNANKLTTQCDQTLHALGLILDYKSLYYEESPAAVRMDKILVFQRLKGFYYLGVYLNARFNTSSFPEWVVIHRALKSAREGIEASHDDEDGQKNFRKLLRFSINIICQSPDARAHSN